jgi:hypothetical protein
VTDHTHVRDADLHYVDRDTCVHRLRPVAASSQCPRQPSFIINSAYPTCDGHVVAVVVTLHDRAIPDVVVRRIV